MAQPPTSESTDRITVEEMTKMFMDEVQNVTKGAELRIKEFGTFLKEYAAGEISPDQAMKKIVAYQLKWDEAVPGVYMVAGRTDEEIHALMESEESWRALASKKRPGSAARGGQNDAKPDTPSRS